MLEAINPLGITTYYDYDAFGRLKEAYIIEDNIKKVVQKYDYHYRDQ
jgi:YD repeat-containing protein